MNVAAVLAHKGSQVATMRASDSVADLLAELDEQAIGAVVVTSPAGHVEGMVSERDVVRGLHRRGARLLAAPIAEIMTERVVSCSPVDLVEQLTVVMTQRRIRHLPVVDEGELIGIVSIGDVVKSRIGQLEDDQDQLRAYITRG